MAKKQFDMNKVLPEETRELFTVRLERNRNVTKVHFAKYGEVDFKKLSVRAAQNLVNLGAYFIAPRNDQSTTSID